MSVSAPPLPSVRLNGIRWQTYEAMLADLGDHPVRLTYDCGELEIVSLSHRHERLKTLIGRMVETLTEELGILHEVGGSMTWKRTDLEKGLEPDECYWIQGESRVRGREVDSENDPPPDLVVEIDITRGSMDRQKIYAALGVPEIWRHDGERISFLLLDAAGYRESSMSRCFPWLAAKDFGAQLDRSAETDLVTWIRGFRAWVGLVALPEDGRP